MSTNERVLLLDWGIGGLSVYNEVRRLRSDILCLYVSDSGFTPYGKLPAPKLAARVAGIIGAAKERHSISSTVIACNSASTVLKEVQLIAGDNKIFGVIRAGLELVLECGMQNIGVIGGLRTIEAKVFSSALSSQDIQVKEQVAQPLSALIEAGVLAGPTLEKELKSILAPLKTVEALLLACTHYPAVAAEIQKLLPQTLLLDPAARTAQHLSAALPRSQRLHGEDLFFTTGSIAITERSARAAFGLQNSFSGWEMPSGF
jgi:glutamate racemase